MIEDKKLYPVTILPSIKKPTIDILFRNNIIFIRDIVEMEESSLIKLSRLDITDVHSLKKSDKLYFNSNLKSNI